MYTVSNKAKVLPPLSADLIPSRYKWLSLEMAEPNLGVPKGDKPLASVTYLLSSDYAGNRGWASASTLQITFSSDERPDVPTINDAINELFYRFPTIRTFTLNLTSSIFFQEWGLDIGDNCVTECATLSWASIKENGRAITTWYLNISGLNATTNQWITGAWDFDNYELGSVTGGLNESKFYYLTGEDWSGKRGTDVFEVRFVGPTYYGGSSQDLLNMDAVSLAQAVLDDRQDIKLTDRLTGNITFNTAGNKRFFVAVPQGGQIPAFSVGAFPVICSQRNNIFITSPNTGETVEYTILVSPSFYQLNQTVRLS